MTEREALEIHGYVFTSDSDSESGQSEFDDAYYAARPPPLSLQGFKIVKINELNVNNEGKVPITIIQQNTTLEEKGNQEKKPIPRRRQAHGDNVIYPRETNESAGMQLYANCNSQPRSIQNTNTPKNNEHKNWTQNHQPKPGFNNKHGLSSHTMNNSSEGVRRDLINPYNVQNPNETELYQNAIFTIPAERRLDPITSGPILVQRDEEVVAITQQEPKDTQESVNSTAETENCLLLALERLFCC